MIGVRSGDRPVSIPTCISGIQWIGVYSDDGLHYCDGRFLPQCGSTTFVELYGHGIANYELARIRGKPVFEPLAVSRANLALERLKSCIIRHSPVGVSLPANWLLVQGWAVGWCAGTRKTITGLKTSGLVREYCRRRQPGRDRSAGRSCQTPIDSSLLVPLLFFVRNSQSETVGSLCTPCGILRIPYNGNVAIVWPGYLRVGVNLAGVTVLVRRL